MAKHYRISVQVEIVESDAVLQDEPQEMDSGHFELVIDEDQAWSIDACEQAVLQTNYPAIRAALATHLSALSEQVCVTATLEDIETTTYRVDGEVGRFTFETHRGVDAAGQVVDTQALFPTLTGQEWYRTVGFKELGLVHGTVEGSFRHSATWLNRVRHQPEGTPWRTLSHNSAREGEQLLAHLEEHAEHILKTHAFTDTQPPADEQAAYQHQKLVSQPPEQVQTALAKCAPDTRYVAEMARNPVAYEVAAQSVQVSIDPVGVKHQKEVHDHVPKEQKRDLVYQTVAHIQHRDRVYLLNGRSIALVLRLVLAFLLHNQLLKNNLVFFIDGERSLSKTILQVFAWFGPVQLILDWPHLQDKCRAGLSMALKGRAIRNQVLEQLCPLLWAGCVESAIELLRDLDSDYIRDAGRLDQLIGYFERQRAYMPCYAVRKELGLRNSSNRGEKANDLLVSKRQKHNGMSWSTSGSLALAALTALVRNNEYSQWFRLRSIQFAFAS